MPAASVSWPSSSPASRRPRRSPSSVRPVRASRRRCGPGSSPRSPPTCCPAARRGPSSSCGPARTRCASSPVAALGRGHERRRRPPRRPHHRGRRRHAPGCLSSSTSSRRCGPSATTSTERRQFLDTLAELATDPRSDVTVVVALRADRTRRAGRARRPGALVGDATVLVGAADAGARSRRTIDRPAAAAGLRLDEGLADTIVSDAGAEPGLLPLLSTSLTQLWEQRDGTSAHLRGIRAHRRSERRHRHARRGVLRRPDARRSRATARTLLLRLTGPGDGAGVTRRRVPLHGAGRAARQG